MAFGAMGGAGGSWDDEEKKKRERLRNTNSVLGISGIGQMANEAAARNKASQEIRTPYNSTAESRASNAALLNKIGVDPTNPYVKGVPKPEPANNYPSVYAGKQQSIPEEAISGTYVEQPQQTTPPRIGFNPVNNPQAIKNNGSGFRMPNAPRRTMAEQQERQALLRDASTAHKGAQNGQLTASQMQLRAGIIGADDKYKNDQYGAQLGAASQMAQAQMSQDGANQRAVLGEAGTNARLNSQLGFDAAKFQQTAAAEQQRSGLDARRLDMEQANNDVANFAPKQLNALYEKYDAAQSDEDRSAIAKQIQALKGVADKKSKPIVITQTGESPLPGDLGGVKKNPSIIYDPDSNEFINLPKKEINFSDPEVLAIVGNRDLSDEEMQAQIAALYS
ncbi:hypothetical protein [Psychrobacter sp.]|uniref:hypothetical protein n=1 Tax=Psychrobacter sp. TaxID=56811 RepID=UPI002FDA7B54